MRPIVSCCDTKSIVIDYGNIKNWLSDELRVSHAVLHIHVGMIIFLLASLLLRRRLTVWGPALVVLALEASNELFDLARYQVSNWHWRPSGTVEDVFNTMLWPLVLTLVLRGMRADA